MARVSHFYGFDATKLSREALAGFDLNIKKLRATHILNDVLPYSSVSITQNDVYELVYDATGDEDKAQQAAYNFHLQKMAQQQGG